jgi:hypothetical protein
MKRVTGVIMFTVVVLLVLLQDASLTIWQLGKCE